ncbi:MULTISPECIES: DUF3126 family protein [Massilia]|nr:MULTISPECIES: DUF3126 family protein [Massilia]NHZ98056.1 hypothetical protein [Massilia sp. CCM 8734]
MRLAADPQHPDYDAVMLPANVYLNGEYLGHCIFADEDSGEAVCAALNSDGSIYLVDDEFATEVMCGHIRIEKRTTPGAAGFDAWMRERTGAAHAAYMARHSAGGQAYA